MSFKYVNVFDLIQYFWESDKMKFKMITHIHSVFDGMIQENAVHGFPNLLKSSEWKWKIWNSSGNFGSGTKFLDFFGRMQKIHSIVIMFRHSRGHGQNIRVKNDVITIEPDNIDQNVVWSGANFDFSLGRCRLSRFVEGHDDDSSTIFLDSFGLFWLEMEISILIFLVYTQACQHMSAVLAIKVWIRKFSFIVIY